MSWVRRLDQDYGLADDRFQAAALGTAPIEAAELDRDPPGHLVDVLAERTGTSRGRIRAMTLAGYVPLLIDALAPSPDLLATYACQLGSVLPPEGRRREPRPLGLAWLPWIAADLVEGPPRCWRACLAGDAVPYVRIHWRAAWMASCPTHGVLLQPTAVGAWGFCPEREDEPPPRSLIDLDRLTLAAITTGLVALPTGEVIHAGVWLGGFGPSSTRSRGRCTGSAAPGPGWPRPGSRPAFRSGCGCASPGTPSRRSPRIGA